MAQSRRPELIFAVSQQVGHSWPLRDDWTRYNNADMLLPSRCPWQRNDNETKRRHWVRNTQTQTSARQKWNAFIYHKDFERPLSSFASSMYLNKKSSFGYTKPVSKCTAFEDNNGVIGLTTAEKLRP
mmetsp:Transcript_10314/g.24788  ORF Transcript_10314/g.24788 Transcript_10314/m.24788 type:complete len:127 (-) Transcript_10314:3362-3742(-)